MKTLKVFKYIPPFTYAAEVLWAPYPFVPEDMSTFVHSPIAQQFQEHSYLLHSPYLHQP